jgi:bacteriocin-like protein
MMTTQSKSEKGPQPATASTANTGAEAEAPAEIVQELTDKELRAVSGGTSISNSGNGVGNDSKMK